MAQNLPTVEQFFPCWSQLTADQQDDLCRHSQPRRFTKGERIYPYKGECLGLMLVQQGQFRVFILSDEGKEVTLYRLLELDTCLFSASCVMNNIQFDIQIEAEKDTDALLVPTSLYERLTQQSIAMAAYTNQLMSARFSDVMWTLEQVLFKSMDARIAQFLLEQSSLQQTDELSVTHDVIARDLGTAREVVSRMLKYFQDDGLLTVGRGRITLLDVKRLASLAE